MPDERDKQPIENPGRGGGRPDDVPPGPPEGVPPGPPEGVPPGPPDPPKPPPRRVG